MNIEVGGKYIFMRYNQIGFQDKFYIMSQMVKETYKFLVRGGVTLKIRHLFSVTSPLCKRTMKGFRRPVRERSSKCKIKKGIRSAKSIYFIYRRVLIASTSDYSPNPG